MKTLRINITKTKIKNTTSYGYPIYATSVQGGENARFHWNMDYYLIDVPDEYVLDESVMSLSLPEDETNLQKPISSKKITQLAFRNRFTFAERVAIESAKSASLEIKVLTDDMGSAKFIDLSRPDTIAGVGYMVIAGVVTEIRAGEILNNPVTALEEYES